ncbi:hypothetical protein [Paracoccus beibuensis]|uniref:hypothetical protein n=1 Tax=Paracoccus beibuensis TaxID=547602 RepID=UPI00223FA7A6|nr:hypothetical protein [Paracoccus beibuensis]
MRDAVDAFSMTLIDTFSRQSARRGGHMNDHLHMIPHRRPDGTRRVEIQTSLEQIRVPWLIRNPWHPLAILHQDQQLQRESLGARFVKYPFDQAVFGVQLQSCWTSAFASSISFRMRAVRAAFAGFPALIMVWYL